MADFSGYRVLSFDCYGTLIDWESGISAALAVWAEAHHDQTDPDELLATFSVIETEVQGSASPAPLYPAVLAETLRRIGAHHHVAVTEADAARFGASVPDWPAFADSVESLGRLQQRYQLVIVSNIDRTSFAASNRRLEVRFDRIITAEEVGSYKPRDPHFDALLASLADLGRTPSQLLHVAQSLYHDHEPAARHGLDSVWIDRRHDRDGPGATPVPRSDGFEPPDWRYPSLAAFADAALE